MKDYLIVVTAYIPYPTAYEYRMPASGMHTAISRSIVDFRKTIGRKKVRKLTATATLLGMAMA